MLPYRWIALLGGSPTGFAMMWVPLLLLGLDMAVREDRLSGGILAGVAVLFSCWSDTHVFFFSALLVPGWCLIALAARRTFDWRKPGAYLRIIRALAPMLVFCAVVLVYILLMGRDLADSRVSQGRSLAEVTSFSPRPSGLFGWQTYNISSQAYFGTAAAAVIVAGWMFMGIGCLRKPGKYRGDCVVLTVLCVGITCLVWLALGLHAPFGGKLLTVCRKLIPPYAMIRQTGKIYCLLPSLLAVAMALALSAMFGFDRSNWRCKAFIGAIGLLMVLEYRSQISPTICLISEEQSAYRAVAEDARSEGREPRCLAVVLWPGDSHWSSLYQHFASLYRIRMVNGYRPFVPRDYFENVFSRFDSVNMGELSNDQLDDLTRRDIRYLILHEDAFPEKISAYPVVFTLRRLLNHPRLSLLEQDANVWAFKILPAGRVRPETGSDWNLFLPARAWEMERSDGMDVTVCSDAAASGGGFVSLSHAGAFVQTRLTKSVTAPDQRWMIRARGNGTVACDTVIDGEVRAEADIDVDSSAWVWKKLVMPPLQGYSAVSLRVRCKNGVVDLDTILLAAGEWRGIRAGESLELPAPCFFHAGFTDMTSDGVVLSATRDPTAIVFYGPKMPLETGMYEVELTFLSRAEIGTPLGKFNMRWRGDEEGNWVAVSAGRPARHRFVQERNLPVCLAFFFFGETDMEIRKVIFRRLD